MATTSGGAVGQVVQVQGAVVDVEFPPDQLPEIYNALQIPMDTGVTLTLEVQQHLGNDWVRAVAMSTTDGLRRGAKATDIGAPAAGRAGKLPTIGYVGAASGHNAAAPPISVMNSRRFH